MKFEASPITTLATLSKVLSVDEITLERLGSDPIYRPKFIPRKGGSPRALNIPCDNLKLVQRKIVDRIFCHIHFHENLFGSIKDADSPRDYIRCAQKHCCAGIVSSIDIQSFFDYITSEHVKTIFKDFFKYSEEVSQRLTDLTTFDNALPQGAPTSPIIANLVFFKEESNIIKQCEREQVRYTRYLDDIILSHHNNSHQIQRCRHRVVRMIEKNGFHLNQTKSITHTRNSQHLTVLGIIINFQNPRISKQERRNTRAAVKHLENKAKIANARKGLEYHKLWHKTSGRLSKLQRLNYAEYNKLRSRMRKILPLSDDKERHRLYRLVQNLEKNHKTVNNVQAFITTLNRATYRAGVLGRSERSHADNLLERLRNIRRAMS